jgi:hypothetical protein
MPSSQAILRVFYTIRFYTVHFYYPILVSFAAGVE